ncbi:MAG: hypothetical protein C4293_13775, partial [Nitrospiraceae bacterium]
LQVPGRPQRRFSKAALAHISSYHWPGNVRELRNVVERLILLSAPGSAEPIGTEELAGVFPKAQVMPETSQSEPLNSLEDAEKDHILRVLQAHGGNKAQTSRTLGIDYKTLLTKLKKYGVS